MSLEGGAPDNRVADHGHYRPTTPVQPAFAPNATTRPLTHNTPLTRDTWACERACRPTRGDRPFSVSLELGAYRLCCESATVTSTRWNSFSSL